MKTFAWSTLSAGIALVIAFWITLFDGGIIADATGGVGRITPGQTVIGIGGLLLTLAGIALLVVAARRPPIRGRLAD